MAQSMRGQLAAGWSVLGHGGVHVMVLHSVVGRIYDHLSLIISNIIIEIVLIRRTMDSDKYV